MKEFKMVADITFNAINIDDAYLLLSEHFIRLRLEKSTPLIKTGHIDISDTTLDK